MQYATVPIYIRQDDPDITQYSFLIKTENVGTLDLQICCENVQELTTCVNYVLEVTEATHCEPNVNVLTGSISDTFVQEVNGEATPQLLFSKSSTYSLTGSYTPPTTEAACDSPTITMKIGDNICCTSSSDPVFWDSSALGVYYSTEFLLSQQTYTLTIDFNVNTTPLQFSFALEVACGDSSTINSNIAQLEYSFNVGDIENTILFEPFTCSVDNCCLNGLTYSYSVDATNILTSPTQDILI